MRREWPRDSYNAKQPHEFAPLYAEQGDFLPSHLASRLARSSGAALQEDTLPLAPMQLMAPRRCLCGCGFDLCQRSLLRKH
jgi:hypothetical protein